MTHFSRLAFCCGLWVIMLMKKTGGRWDWWELPLKQRLILEMENKSFVKWWVETLRVAKSLLSSSEGKDLTDSRNAVTDWLIKIIYSAIPILRWTCCYFIINIPNLIYTFHYNWCYIKNTCNITCIHIYIYWVKIISELSLLHLSSLKLNPFYHSA